VIRPSARRMKRSIVNPSATVSTVQTFRKCRTTRNRLRIQNAHVRRRHTSADTSVITIIVIARGQTACRMTIKIVFGSSRFNEPWRRGFIFIFYSFFTPLSTSISVTSGQNFPPDDATRVSMQIYESRRSLFFSRYLTRIVSRSSSCTHSVACVYARNACRYDMCTRREILMILMEKRLWKKKK
jgi:hypothetical protein